MTKHVVKKVTIKQTRSKNRCPKYQRATLAALGLGKMNRVVTHNWTPSIQGMVNTVTHLVEVVEAK